MDGDVFLFVLKKIILFVLFTLFILTGCQKEYTVTSHDSTFKVRPLNKVSMVPYIISEMTLEQKIAQQFILGFNGTTYNQSLAQYQQLNIGGVILFSRNIENEMQVTQLNNSIKANNKYIPMFIAVDQEGGRVNRFPSNIPNIEPAYQISKAGNPQYAYDKGEYIGRKLKQLGFNVDFAPSLDIWSNQSNKVIGDRSFGTSYNEVIRYAMPFNRGINDQFIITSGKHFPGHGDTLEDSHDSLPVSNMDKQRLMENELKPFEAAIKDDIDMIMVSHILFPQIDDKRPSSMSKIMVTNMLKNNLHYKGVIITDDLAMGAIVNHYSREQALLNSLNAGQTMLLIGSDIGDISYQIEFIKAQVKAGNIDEKIIDENVQKILKLKQKYGIV